MSLDVLIINDSSAGTEIVTGTSSVALLQNSITIMNKIERDVEQLSLPKKRNKRKRHKSYFGKSYDITPRKPTRFNRGMNRCPKFLTLI